MASDGPRSARSLRSLFVGELMWLAWLLVLVVGIIHYATDPHVHWVHDLMRRLYYLPILLAAFSQGLRGGFAVAVVASLSYAPHAFLLPMAHHDPGTTLNKALEIILYNVIGVLAGILADRETKRRRQAEQAVADQQRMADQLVRAGRLAALGELVAGIAHEIKNPLHTIKGTAEIVEDVIPADAEEAKMWRLLRQEVERLERIAERFLSFARPSSPTLERQSFGEVYARLAELLRAQVHGAADVELHVVDLSTDVAADEVNVDRDQFAQIAVNIASNALRAMEGRGTLSVRGGRRRDVEEAPWVFAEIVNDGPAIPQEDLERIFDPFYSKSEGGTGLGLAIASRLAEAQSGYVEARNTENGVAFSIVIPAPPS